MITPVSKSAIPLSYLDTDDAMTANSDVKVPSQNAIVAYVAAHAGSPTVATGAEVDTGTNNTKMVTPLAMEDSAYIKSSGNAATSTLAAAATALATPRAINGVNFDGTANITVPDITVTAAPASDVTAYGIKISLTAGVTMAFGDVGYIKSDGKVGLIDADAIATMSGIVMATAAISADAAGTFLLMGVARNDAWNWTVGGLIYGTVTGTTGNTLSQTAVSGTDDVVQIMGVATHADRMIFKPELIQVELV